MPELFRRRYRLQVDTMATETVDLVFDVTRTLKPEPGTAQIRAYNLNQDERDAVHEADDAIVQLSAGYEGDVPGIFVGDLRSAVTRREGPDLVTVIEAGDGEKRYRRARTKRKFSPGASVGDVIKGVAKDLGIEDGNVAEVVTDAAFEGLGRIFSKGAVTDGQAAAELTRLTESAGLEWSVQDGQVQLLKRGEALEDTAIVLRSDTGLIGSPEVTSKNKLKARTLMIPDLFPGRKIKMEHETVTGFYRVQQAKYRGDTRGQDWGIRLECEPLEGQA